MSRIFISHSSRDNPKAAALRDWLVSHGWDDLFLDFDPMRGLAAGDRWMDALRQAADRCEAVICLVSEAWLESDWCEDEARMAWHWGKRIISVLIDDVPIERIPKWLSAEWQFVNLAAPGEHSSIDTAVPPDGAPHTVSFHAEGLERLRRGLEKAGLAADTFTWPPVHDPERAPYRGLRPLEAEDAGIFFGRAAQMVAAFDELRSLREKGQGCLFVIQGASGAGKSSFLRAGLLPRLSRDDRHFLPLPIIRPETAVISGETGLMTALEQACAERGLRVPRAELRRDLEQGAGAVTRRLAALQAAVPIVTPESGVRTEPPTIVLPIDQGEELFAAGNGESGQFFGLLTELLKSPVHLIACFAIRSESFHQLQEVPLPDGIRRVPFDLPPVQRGAYQKIIEGPVAALPQARKLEIAPDLTQRLLSDLEHGAGADPLPLLAFTLERLYADYGRSGRLELAHYQELGGLSGSITAAVEAAIKDAQDKGAAPESRTQSLSLLRRAFIPCLCRVDPDSRMPMRRVARLDEIPQEAWGLVEELVNHRLLVSSIRKNGSEAGETVIDLAHESLLRQWPRLRAWLMQETDALLILESVQRAAGDWAQAGGKDDSLLLHRGGRLEDALTLAERRDLASAFSDQDRTYLEACRVGELRQRRTRRRFWVATAIASGLTAMIYVMVSQFLTIREAGSTIIAQKSREANAKHDYEMGLLWALAAVPQPGELLAPNERLAHTQLLRAVHNSRLVRKLSDEYGPIEKVAYSADEHRILIATSDQTARLLNAETGETLRRFGQPRTPVSGAMFLPHDVAGFPHRNSMGPGSIRQLAMIEGPGQTYGQDEEISAGFVAISPDGTRVLTAEEAGTARVWNLNSDESVLLSGHSSNIKHAVFSADGTKVLTGSMDGTARLWNADSGEEMKILQPHDREVDQVAMTPDGTRFLTVSLKEGKARLWDVEADSPRHVFPDGASVALAESTGAVKRATLSPDGTHVLSYGSADGKAFLWDGDAGGLSLVLSGHGEAITYGTFSADDRRILTVSIDKSARLWDAESGSALQDFSGHDGPVLHAAFSRQGPDRIVTTSRDGTARLWDASTGALLSILGGHDASVDHAVLSSDGTRLLTGSSDATVRIWTTSTRTQSIEMKGHAGPVWGAVFSPDGGRILTFSPDGTVRLWDGQTGEESRVIRAHESHVNHAVFSPDGRRVLTTSSDKSARLWDVRSGERLRNFEGHSGPVMHAVFSPDGRRMLTTSTDNTARLWDTGRDVSLRVLSGHQELIRHASFSPDGTRVATASYDDTARIWNSETGELIHTLHHDNDVYRAVFSPDGSRLATASKDETVRLWNAKTGKRLNILEGHEGPVVHVAFSQDGKRIVTASHDNTARIWNARNGRFLHSFKGHVGPLSFAEFSPDGERVLTASADGTARLWDARTDEVLNEFLGHDDSVYRATFAPDGKRIVTASFDGTARLWRLPDVYFDALEERVAKACEMAERTGVTEFAAEDMGEPEFRIRFPRSPRYADPCKRPNLLTWEYYWHVLPDVIGWPGN